MLFLVPSETFFFLGDESVEDDDEFTYDDSFLWLIADFLVQPVMNSTHFREPLLFGPFSFLDTSHVTYLFNDIFPRSFNEDISRWDVSQVIDMSFLFDGLQKFNQSLEHWDVSNVKHMSGMFYGASSFNQPLEKWNVSKVKDMTDMFSYAFSFNQPIENWNISEVITMTGMLYSAFHFKQSLENWKEYVPDVDKRVREKSIFTRIRFLGKMGGVAWDH
jgi:surface protein